MKPKLLEAFGVSEADLEANQQGSITKAQHYHILRTRLERDRYDVPFFSGLFLGMMMLAFGILGFAGIIVPARSSNELSTIAIFIVGIVVLCATAYYLWLVWRDFHADIQDDIVLALEGRVGFEIGEGKYPEHKVRLEGHEFAVKRDVLMAMQNGQVYRLYYAPHSHVLLSAEPLP